MEKYRRGRKEFAAVRMIETGELKKRVLLQNGKSKNENHIYDIYEICNVYYIV